MYLNLHFVFKMFVLKFFSNGLKSNISKRNFKFILIVGLLFSISSCKNIYEEVGDHESTASILYQARLYLADGQWALAIEQFESLSAATLLVEDVAVEYASAYSGRCGLDFLSLADNLENLSTTRPLVMLMQSFTASSLTFFDDCKMAETILKTVDNGSGVMTSERGKYLMAFNSLAKVGVLLNFYADTNKNDILDPAWDPCGASGATELPVAAVNEIGTALNLFIANISGLSGTSDVLSALTSLCDGLPAGPTNFCSIVETTGFTDLHRQGLRGIVREKDDGIGLGVTGATTILGSACEP